MEFIVPLNIKLSKAMEQFVAEQVAARGLRNGNAFVHQLLKEERNRLAVQDMIKNLEAAAASGYHPVTDELWEERKQRVLKNFQAKERGKVRIRKLAR